MPKVVSLPRSCISQYFYLYWNADNSHPGQLWMKWTIEVCSGLFLTQELHFSVPYLCLVYWWLQYLIRALQFVEFLKCVALNPGHSCHPSIPVNIIAHIHYFCPGRCLCLYVCIILDKCHLRKKKFVHEYCTFNTHLLCICCRMRCRALFFLHLLF